MNTTLPRVVTCGCDAPVSDPSPQLVIAAKSHIRVPGSLHAGMLGYYPLGPFHGVDISGHGNHAAARIAEPQTVSGILCEQAEVFDGRQSYTLPSNLGFGEIVTVSAFHRPQRSRLETTLLSIGDNLRFGLSWNLEPIVVINERDSDEVIISADPISADQWHHIAFVRDEIEYRIYIDGQPVDLLHEGNSVKIARANVPITPGPAAISEYRGGSGLYGPTQDVIIRVVAMEAHEIAAEYDSYCTAFFEVVP